MTDQNKQQEEKLVFHDEKGAACTPDDFGDLLDKFMQGTGQFYVTDQHGTQYFVSAKIEFVEM